MDMPLENMQTEATCIATMVLEKTCYLVCRMSRLQTVPAFPDLRRNLLWCFAKLDQAQKQQPNCSNCSHILYIQEMG